MAKELIAVGNDVHEIDVKPITLICKGAYCPDVQYAERVRLTLEVCTYHMDRTQTFHSRTPELFKIVFPDYDKEVTPDIIRQEGLGMQHVAGRMDMTLKFMDTGVKFAWVYPEAGLHPAAQVNLGDVLIRLALV